MNISINQLLRFCSLLQMITQIHTCWEERVPQKNRTFPLQNTRRVSMNWTDWKGESSKVVNWGNFVPYWEFFDLEGDCVSVDKEKKNDWNLFMLKGNVTILRGGGEIPRKIWLNNFLSKYSVTNSIKHGIKIVQHIFFFTSSSKVGICTSIVVLQEFMHIFQIWQSCKLGNIYIWRNVLSSKILKWCRVLIMI